MSTPVGLADLHNQWSNYLESDLLMIIFILVWKILISMNFYDFLWFFMMTMTSRRPASALGSLLPEFGRFGNHDQMSFEDLIITMMIMTMMMMKMVMMVIQTKPTLKLWRWWWKSTLWFRSRRTFARADLETAAQIPLCADDRDEDDRDRSDDDCEETFNNPDPPTCICSITLQARVTLTFHRPDTLFAENHFSQ